MPKKPSGFEILALDILIHQDPDFMPNERIDIEQLNMKRLRKYWKRIYILNQAFKKIQRYEIYFSEFYPSTAEIMREEALDHHMHAYLTDLTILRHAIISLLNDLHVDIRADTSNKEEADNFFKECKRVTHKRFNNVTKHRNPHDHAQDRFIDEDNQRASFLKTFLQTSKLFPNKVNEEYLQTEADLSFAKSKENKCKMARDNAKGLAKNMEALFVILEDCLYRYLGIKPIIREKLKNVKWTDD